MKLTAILVSVWMGIFGSFLAQMAKAFGPTPISITPHWLTYLPALLIVTGAVGLVLYKVAPAQPHKNSAQDLPADAPLVELTEA